MSSAKLLVAGDTRPRICRRRARPWSRSARKRRSRAACAARPGRRSSRRMQIPRRTGRRPKRPEPRRRSIDSIGFAARSRRAREIPAHCSPGADRRSEDAASRRAAALRRRCRSWARKMRQTNFATLAAYLAEGDRPPRRGPRAHAASARRRGTKPPPVRWRESILAYAKTGPGKQIARSRISSRRCRRASELASLLAAGGTPRACARNCAGSASASSW